MKHLRSIHLCLAIASAILLATVAQAAAAGELSIQSLTQPQSGAWTRDSLKSLLDTPLVLLGVMFLASISNGLKQVSTAKKAGSDVTFAEYWSHIPDTLATIMGNLLAFAALILFDQLNFASALGIGFGVNSVTDMLPGKRSIELAKSTSTDTT